MKNFTDSMWYYNVESNVKAENAWYIYVHVYICIYVAFRVNSDAVLPSSPSAQTLNSASFYKHLRDCLGT